MLDSNQQVALDRLLPVLNSSLRWVRISQQLKLHIEFTVLQASVGPVSTYNFPGCV